MTFFGGPTGLTESRSIGLGSTYSRTNMLGRQYAPFSNPFFDQASTYTPQSVKSLFGFCRYYFLTHGVINSICTKASEYPITDVILTHQDRGVVDRWRGLILGDMGYRTHQFEANLDYYVTGNAFISPSFPFRKLIICASCNGRVDAITYSKHWRYSDHRFYLTCPKCGQSDFATATDDYQPKPSDIGMIRWNPENVSIFHNEATGRMDYALDLSSRFRSLIATGRKDVVATTPQIFLQAVKERRSLVFDKREVFHMRRPALSSMEQGWGVPLLMPVMKDAFYMQIMKKAQECVHPDTLLDTARGLVPARAVEVGDVVRTHTGALHPVVARRVKPMQEDRDFSITLQVSGLRDFASTFSNNHPIYVLRRNDIARRADTKEHRRSSYVLRNPSLYDLTWVNAEEVEEGQYIGFPLARGKECQGVDTAAYGDFNAVTADWVYTEASQVSAEDFEDCTDRTKYVQRLRAGEKAPRRMRRHLELDDNLAYIAGWYIGDGCASDRHIVFCMGPDDDGVALQEAIREVFPFTTFSPRVLTESRGWNLEVYGSAFARFMKGWIPGDAHAKAVPSEIENASDEVVAAFLRGYLESDGYEGPQCAQIVTCNRALAYTTWRLALSLRCIGTVAEVGARDTVITNLLGEEQELLGDGRLSYHVTWTTRSRDRLMGLLYGGEAPEVTSGKSGFFFGDYFCGRVSAVEHGWCDEVISFEVAEDHTFCTPGMATHNTVLLTHMVPQIFLYPQPATSGADPFSTVNLADWRGHIQREIGRQRMDPSYYGILPFPLGHQIIGENGRSLLLMQEIRSMAELIAIGMGFPQDLVFGQGTYAGTSVSMRMVENFFLSNVQSHYRLIHWFMGRVGHYLNWPVPTARFKPFKMADDLQRMAMAAQLNQQSKISDSTLLAMMDFDVQDEAGLQVKETTIRMEALKKQQLAQAEIQGEAMVVQARYQAQAQAIAQKAALEAGGAPQPGFEAQMGSGLSTAPTGLPLDQVAAGIASQLSGQPREMQDSSLKQIEGTQPELAELVRQHIVSPSSGSAVDNRPLPEQRPPRRLSLGGAGG